MNAHLPAKPFLLPMLFAVAVVNAADTLPQKAFDVEDGVVAVVAGVMPSPAATSALPFGKLKYPTRYFVELTNESQYPLWLDATWTFPEKNKAGKPKTVRSTKVPRGGTYAFFSDKLGVIAEQAILVNIQAWSDEKRVNIVGSQKAELYFDQPSIDHFLAGFPNAFKGKSSDYQQSVVISGWHDLPVPRTDVTGTLADATLQADIQQILWKTDSRKRWTCEREIIAATTVDVSDSQMLSVQAAEAQQEAQLDQFNDTLNIEKWTVKSCGQEIDYEVMMSASQSGGSDVVVLETTGRHVLQEQE